MVDGGRGPRRHTFERKCPGNLERQKWESVRENLGEIKNGVSEQGVFDGTGPVTTRRPTNLVTSQKSEVIRTVLLSPEGGRGGPCQRRTIDPEETTGGGGGDGQETSGEEQE